jgi:hypothetical protein
MKILLKFGKLFGILILSVSIILFVASYLLKDKVGFIILRSLNKNISTKLEVESYKLSFFRKFPKASLELKNVLVHSSKDFNYDSFRGINTDTLLYSRSVSMEFKLTDIVKGIYTIETISARSGKANFYTDEAGQVNYNITVKSNSPAEKETLINLERINLTDITAYYNNLDANLIISGPIKSGKLKTRISGSNIDFTADSELQINRFDLLNYRLNNYIAAKLELDLQSSKEGIIFRKGILHIDNYDVELDGIVASGNILDLNVKGKNLDLSDIGRYLPVKFYKSLAGYSPSGNLNITTKIKGKLSSTSNPHIEADWHFKNGRATYKKSDVIFKNVSFTGRFTNGKQNNYESCVISSNDFTATLGASEYTCSVSLENFNSPLIDFSVRGRVFPAEIKEFFSIEGISSADGSADIDMKIIRSKWSAKNFTADGIIDLHPEGTMIFNSLTIGFQENKLLLSNVNGKLNMLNSIRAENFRFKFKGQNFQVDGDFRNLPEWLSGRKVVLTAKADVRIDKFLPENFMEKGEANKSQKNSRAMKLPADMNLDVNFRFDSLRYKTFASSDVEGSMTYNPRSFNFKSLTMKSLSGLISGDGFFVQNKDKSLVARGNFLVKNIDINRAFTTFKDFGQSFLKSENIRGSLSGSLSLLLPMDSLAKFSIKNLTAEGKYHLVNGALINFDPVKQLSKFIELSELENITFDQLDNDFFIRNNYLYVPMMEVKSSAADLSVNGKHSFDNDYEYHVKILLSEILSRKRSKYKPKVTEFGVVEDDGLGRTSLLLKVIGKGETAKVSYDIKAASAEVKKNITKEKQTLKTILNQEYGMYETDSVAKKPPPEKKKQFKIQWDDGE